MREPSTLILCSHGTRRPAGQRAILRLAGAVAERLPRVAVRPAYVDVQEPHVRDLVASLETSDATGHDTVNTVLVPALLSTGYHVKMDLTSAAAARPGVRVAAPLGPDARLTDLLVRRLREALGEALGAETPGPGDAIILAGAGSSDPDARRALVAAAADLAVRLGHPVSAGNAAGGKPSVAELITRARATAAGRVIVASYLLAPGFFADKLAALAGRGADVVTAPLLGPETTPAELVELVLERAGSLAGAEPSSQIIRSASLISNFQLLGR